MNSIREPPEQHQNSQSTKLTQIRGIFARHNLKFAFQMGMFFNVQFTPIL